MSSASTSILVDVVSLVLEILLLSKTAKFPFPTMDFILKSFFFESSNISETG